jgi:carbamoyl-phosphate synthase large subunit
LLDKYLTYKFFEENGIPSVPTYNDIDKVIEDLEHFKLDFPLIVKPIRGSASVGIHKVTSIKELKMFQDMSDEIVVQPFISGEEFGVDCYIDLITNEVTNIFIKRKI